MSPKPIPLFDRNRGHPPRPDLTPAGVLRAGAVEDAACGTGAAGAKRPRWRRAQRYAYQPGTLSPLPPGVTAPQKNLIIGGESPRAVAPPESFSRRSDRNRQDIIGEAGSAHPRA
jgi:hypothetical protein